MTDLERRVAGRLVEFAKVVVTIAAFLLLVWAADGVLNVVTHPVAVQRPG